MMLLRFQYFFLNVAYSDFKTQVLHLGTMSCNFLDVSELNSVQLSSIDRKGKLHFDKNTNAD